MQYPKTETLEEFMNRALHDPVYGYYARNIRGIGQRGDFTTAPQLSSIPAKSIAQWIQKSLKHTNTRHIIEIGPGTGALTGQVLSFLPILTRLRCQFHLVESSKSLALIQKKNLGKRVTHHKTIQEAIRACRGCAVIFSNELVDAFPARIFKKQNNQWHELALDHTSGNSIEFLHPASKLPPSSVFSLPFKEGQVVEVHDSYRIWLEAWIPLWKKGSMLTIDYGNVAGQIYQNRLRGTLRGYLLHQRTTGAEIYQNVGLQDITCDVNFTDLGQWCAPWMKISQTGNFLKFLESNKSDMTPELLEACAYFHFLIQEPKIG